MKSFRNAIVIVIFITNCESCFSQEIWTIGPMLHYNFGGEKRNTSFAIEMAYWNLNNFYHSVDVGIEFERKRFRIYSEGQTGIGLTGLSFGPVVEFEKGNGVHLGVQGSCWINYFLGVDYRIRFIDHQKIQAAGLYAKLPIATSGLDDDGDGSSDWGDWD